VGPASRLLTAALRQRLAGKVSAGRRLLPYKEVIVQVVKPPAKSWLMTAMATTTATVMPAWKAAPMAKPPIRVYRQGRTRRASPAGY
jgi:hypothetical protein